MSRAPRIPEADAVRPGPTGGAAALIAYCASRAYPVPVPEFRFAPGRRYAFDLAWPLKMLALEIEGGIYGRGKPCPVCRRKPPAGHGSIDRMLRDMAKYNLAAELGWRVARCRPEEVASGAAFALLDRLLGRGNPGLSTGGPGE